MANIASADEPTFEVIARLIAGNRPVPDWLPASLEKLAASGLPFARRKESEQLGRAEMRQKLAALTNAARSILPSISDTRILEQLDDADGEPVSAEFLNAFANHLTGFAGLTERAAAAIREGGGRDRAHAVNAVSARRLCAIVIYEAWRLVRGKAPAPGNATAQRAACGLWRMSGGPNKSWGDDELQGWRKELRAIERQPDDAELARIRQILLWTPPDTVTAGIEAAYETAFEAMFAAGSFASCVIDAKQASE
jgi:hypothetical protein